jgi:hypothetical protein
MITRQFDRPVKLHSKKEHRTRVGYASERVAEFRFEPRV